jgi:tyrosine decarboxylase/aspartate 1-decarboxylase
MNHGKRWPPMGRATEDIMQELRSALEENIDYGGEDLVVGFPGTTPAKIGVEAFELFLSNHANNITTHTSGEGEIGFDGTHRLERDAIFMMADLLGAGPVDGYITPGGTESNIMGVLLGREHLALATGSQGRCVILTSMFTHYSIRKAAWVLGIGRDDWRLCRECSERIGKDVSHFYEGHGVDLLGADEGGRLSIEQLEERVEHHYKRGARQFIVVASEGNIMTGGVDDTRRIGEAVTRMRREMDDAGFFLHVDACFGGFVVPFLDDFEHSFSFHVPEVDSVATDVHKMGEVPYPAGMFIYRSDERKFRNLLGVQMGYVPGDTDGTLCGSRPGASAAACYAIFEERGYQGYRQVVERCMANTAYLSERLGNIPEIEVLPHDLNIVAFRLRERTGRELSKEFVESVKLVQHRYPDNFSDPNGHVRMVYKATVMSHVTRAKIDRFVDALEGELRHAH